MKVVIQDSSHTEYHEGGKYTIKSKLLWVSECEYKATMLSNTIPDFPYNPGAVMNVKINKVKKNKIYYTATVDETSWKGMFEKIED